MASSAVLLLILMVVAATVHGHTHTPGGTPAALFWEAALPDSPMPESIAHLVQKGTDHSPLQQHHSAAMILPNACLGYSYRIICNSPAQQASSVEGLFFRESDMRVGRTMTGGSQLPLFVNLEHDIWHAWYGGTSGSICFKLISAFVFIDSVIAKSEHGSQEEAGGNNGTCDLIVGKIQT
ncbi:hypothetical protein TRIUR3_17599 [Triticum urartu]|uniref:Uncharacterized protein n=1 Tax=Triticum urartu TaxID=4572 RepID=M7YKG8_TRIUA|nr:hypothetical protein TRIUR3_17599 [Triticum urartu]